MSKSPLTFRIFHGGKLVREETLALGVIKLGKVPSAHLRLDDESVSRMHAIIEVEPSGTIQLIDLGSTRGTFVNGTKINKASIVDGDVITVGDTRIELSLAPLPVAAAPRHTPPQPVAAVAAPPPLPLPLPLPLPRAAAPLAATPMPAPLAAHFASEIDMPGARAVEVAAMLGDSVVEVKHCMDPSSGKVTRATYALLGTSLLCLAAAGASFVSGVRTAARNAEGLEYWTHVAHKPAHSFRPQQSSGALDGIEIVGLALGIGAAAAGISRSRRERKSPYFRIGTAPGVECATESAPSASFPLVAPTATGDDFVFNFAPSMDGEMIVAGHSTPLSELAASGRARPSQTVQGALELLIPAAARIRTRTGGTTFLVSAVAAPRTQAQPGISFDRRAAMYAAASLVAHLGLYGLANLGSADAASIGIDTQIVEEVAVRTNTTENENTPPPPDKDPADTADNGGSQGGKMKLDEGAAGKPDAQKDDGQMQVKDNHLSAPQIARADALKYAQNAGVLGDMPALNTAISALGGTDAISNGFDASDVYGPLFGAAGEGRGNFGMGRTGFGPGGCPPGEACVGGIGVGNYNTIGGGPGAGHGWHLGNGHGTGDGVHKQLIPSVVIQPPQAIGDLDKSIIKRYVNRQRDKIAYCYESQLLAHPDLAGDITVQFFIQPNGSVQSATGAGFNAEIARCVADVVHNISFPAPRDGGGVQVNYPFHFHMATGQ